MEWVAQWQCLTEAAGNSEASLGAADPGQLGIPALSRAGALWLLVENTGLAGRCRQSVLQGLAFGVSPPEP